MLRPAQTCEGICAFRCVLMMMPICSEGAWTRPLGASWSWGLSGRMLPQLVLLNQPDDSGASALSADPLSLRGALALRLSWQQLDTVQVGLRAGAAVDVITQANSTRSAERLALTPQLGVEVWF